jgi:hypothetical protein
VAAVKGPAGLTCRADPWHGVSNVKARRMAQACTVMNAVFACFGEQAHLQLHAGTAASLPGVAQVLRACAGSRSDDRHASEHALHLTCDSFHAIASTRQIQPGQPRIPSAKIKGACMPPSQQARLRATFARDRTLPPRKLTSDRCHLAMQTSQSCSVCSARTAAHLAQASASPVLATMHCIYLDDKLGNIPAWGRCQSWQRGPHTAARPRLQQRQAPLPRPRRAAAPGTRAAAPAR